MECVCEADMGVVRGILFWHEAVSGIVWWVVGRMAVSCMDGAACGFFLRVRGRREVRPRHAEAERGFPGGKCY